MTCPRSLQHLPSLRSPVAPETERPPRTHTYTHPKPPAVHPDPRALLTESDLGQVQPVDPGDLAQGVGGDEDHHEADGAAGPSVREQGMSAGMGPGSPGDCQPISHPNQPWRRSAVCAEHGSTARGAGGLAKPWSLGERVPPPTTAAGTGRSPERQGHSLPARARGPARPQGSGPLQAATQAATLGPTGQPSTGLTSRLHTPSPEPVTRACSGP